MKRIHCEPHETGISFEYEGAMHRSSQKAFVASGLRAFFVSVGRSRGEPSRVRVWKPARAPRYEKSGVPFGSLGL